jgi:adenylosuccinate synthase
VIPVVGVEVAGERLGGKRRMDFSVAASSDGLCTVLTSTTLTCCLSFLVRAADRRARMGHVPATVIVGAQWGDEGKGKIVDLLAQESDLVCRYQGGPNAGHTIVVDGETFRIRAIPSGIVGGVASAIGAGCVVDPQVLIDELDELERRGRRTDGLVYISGNAHLIMPWHVALDGARERRLGKLQIGTTRRGIGPAYADKATRIGIRVQDLLDPKILREKIELAASEKNVWLERVYGLDPFDVEAVVSQTLGDAERLAPYVADTSLLVDRALRGGQRVLFEGAQGTLLDLDHGTYPFVTSSSPVAAGAAVSFGIGPQRIDEVVGVSKAYVTRVGEGPFPSEIVGPAQARVRELGGEFGTVTGRERRCGWLDLVALRFAVRVNGISSLALTKLDVLSTFDEIPVCVRYRLPDGSETEDFPAHQSDFHHCAPVFETLPGWEEELVGTTLPSAAAEYVSFVGDALDVPVSLVGTGASRDAVLAFTSAS